MSQVQLFDGYIEQISYRQGEIETIYVRNTDGERIAIKISRPARPVNESIALDHTGLYAWLGTQARYCPHLTIIWEPE